MLALCAPALLNSPDAWTQDSKTGPKVLFPAESRQANARFMAADQLIVPGSTPEKLASLVGAFATGAGGWIGLLGDQIGWGPWDQATEEYRQLQKDAGDDLLPSRVDPRGQAQPSHSVRLACNERLASLPGPVIRRYRASFEGAAKSLLQEGKEQRSAILLRRLVEEHYGSRAAEEGLDLLGAMAFANGDFDQARHWWRLLARLPSEADRSTSWEYPDLSLDQALIQAKQILALSFAGEWRRAQDEVKIFQATQGQAVGFLAGRKDRLAKILDETLRQQLPLAHETSAQSWPTFAGSPRRNRPLATFPSSRLWVEGPTWQISLPGPAPDKDLFPTRFSQPPRTPFHPVIANQLVCLADVNNVWAFDLRTGAKRGHFRLEPGVETKGDGAEGEVTPTLAGEQLFARLGRCAPARGPHSNKDAPRGSFLVCLQLPGRSGSSELKERWRIAAKGPNGQPGLFEGDPLVLDQRVWAPLSWQKGGVTHVAIACYHARDAALLWTQPVAEIHGDTSLAPMNNRLTWTGGSIIYASAQGILAALDPWTGRKHWALRLWHPLDEGDAPYRERASCLSVDQQLFYRVQDRLLCVDADHGQVRWQREGLGMTHLWGVARGRVIFATTRGLRAVGADDGSDAAGWAAPAEGSLPSLGRGLLAGGWVLWPTRDPQLPYRAISIEAGQTEQVSHPLDGPDQLDPTRLRRLLPGNLALGEGCLVVAGARELVGYVPPEQLLPERQEQQTSHPSPANLYRLALSQAGAGQRDQALAALMHLEKLPVGVPHRDAWRELAHFRQQELRGEERSLPPTKMPKLLATSSASVNPLQTTGPWQLAWQCPDRYLIVPQHSPLATADSSWVYLRHDDNLSAHESDTGQEQWRQVLPWPIYWLGLHERMLLAGGDHGLLALRLKDGAVLWTFNSPSGKPKDGSLIGDVPVVLRPPGGLSDFQVTSRHVMCFHEQRRLLAVDLASGRLAWQRWAPDGPLQPLFEAGLFFSTYLAHDSAVAVQTNTGQAWILDPATGTIKDSLDVGINPWPGPPLVLDESRLLIPRDQGRLLVRGWRLAKSSLSLSPTPGNTLTGAPAIPFAKGRQLLALIPTNLGTQLAGLDSANSEPRWSIEPGPPVEALAAGAMCVDEQAVYFVRGHNLVAHALKDGKESWQQPLPGQVQSWRLRRDGATILALPQVTASIPWLPCDGRPLTWHAVWQSARPGRRPIALLVFQAADGKLLQHLSLTEEARPTALQFTATGAVLSVGNQTWGVRARLP